MNLRQYKIKPEDNTDTSEAIPYQLQKKEFQIEHTFTCKYEIQKDDIIVIEIYNNDIRILKVICGIKSTCEDIKQNTLLSTSKIFHEIIKEALTGICIREYQIRNKINSQI